jgi:hypothetical protein
VRLCEQPLTLIDVGGMVDEKNEWIARHAFHAVLIAAQAQDLVVWRDFCDRLNLRLVAELHIAYDATEDRIEGVDAGGVLRASVHPLERGENASGRPMARRARIRRVSGARLLALIAERDRDWVREQPQGRIAAHLARRGGAARQRACVPEHRVRD